MTTLPMYDAERLAGLLQILPDVDAVELKLTVPDSDQRPLLRVLGIDPLAAVIRQVAFLDTQDLRLSTAGLVVRVRRTQLKPGDLTVKLRPMLPADVPKGVRGQSGFKVEVDASPAGFTCSCSLTTEVSDRKARELMTGARQLKGLLDRRQRALLADRLPDDVGAGDVLLLGPVQLLKVKIAPKGFSRKLVGEMWMLPGGRRILELSTKCQPAEAFQVAAETKVFLSLHGVDLTAPQEMKTKSVLAALASETI